VSDKPDSRSFLGNFEKAWDEPAEQIRHRGTRRLVEECEAISIRDARQILGKEALISAIRQARPLRLPVLGGHFYVWPVDEPHRLPGKPERWSSLEVGNCRIWLVCTGCRRKVAKLYYYYLAPDSTDRSDLLCRRCHGLIYQAQNCGGNKWYREIARPLKWLLREKRKLLAKQPTPRIAAPLAQIDSAIHILRQRLQPKTQRGREGLSSGMRSRQRRPYRNLNLLEQWAAVREHAYGGPRLPVSVSNATKKLSKSGSSVSKAPVISIETI
jgi:hypothetical protein